MRKDLQSKEGGARKIEFIYLVILSQMLHMSQKKEKKESNTKSLEAGREPGTKFLNGERGFFCWWWCW